MAKNKKLTKATRERMARTGESYTAARRHILAQLASEKTTHANSVEAWVRLAGGGVSQGGFGDVLDQGSQAVLNRLALHPAMRGGRIWFWGRTRPDSPRWELEGDAGIVWLGPEQRDRENPTSKLVVMTRRLQALDGLVDPIRAAEIVIAEFGLY